MRRLLDTHVLLWALSDPRRLSAVTRRLLDDSEVFVSAASIWEIAIKRSIGRIDADPDTVLDALAPAGFRELPISGRHTAAVARLPDHHKDPFDRILVAQATVESMSLLTRDPALKRYGDVVSLI